MNRELAKSVVDMAFAYASKLDQSVARTKSECSDEEFKRYRAAVGKVLGYMYTDVLRLIFREYPDLEPEALRRAGARGES